MNCACHDEPMYWFRDSRYQAGGRWACAVKHREWGRARYARDPIYRLEQNVRDAHNKRLRRIQARRVEHGGA